MRKKKVSLQCITCDNEFEIHHTTKETICYCPFCAEELDGTVNKNPLLTTFDQLDEFDEESLDEDELLDDEAEDDEEDLDEEN